MTVEYDQDFVKRLQSIGMRVKLAGIDKADDGKHKLVAHVYIEHNGKRLLKNVKFGAHGMGDYIIYHKQDGEQVAEQHKKAYIARHSVGEDWSNPTTAAFWSRWLLWNKPTLKESMADVLQRYPQLALAHKNT